MATPIYNNLYLFLFVGLFLLACGILGLLYRRTLIGMLISIELIMNGAGLNFVAFNRFASPDNAYGLAFTIFIMGIAAAEAAIALGIIILIFKRYRHIEGRDIKEMKD
ncbi:MAG TPA: NADH-quinone oxidoreductase subunit NuoK [Syntrophorhabdaceae bacterium]|jgi:NADH:ubiquinone oxidoreductase subunit K|nr:NADH-quinone oxidoreductase subunit NuoK [Syntrophorhabdaceae bacterium]HNZ59209.1 NADH-quinone oxidoreductase subunit NuoK [Syntrophorhabdaceae bacterium]HOB69466.1 NADH-quinone oxidoreductase subunit NuoK [Syntrophorhabdaceae bacterium]HOG40492.1 NADH-quinone oxidoreductase subunit NuoK [Syntrophorhabdaceae bacterium]HQG51333.1 NADH-quinone oxidoreductase subunit NuoK [Syntrophorhabdaceae bacterium]